MYGRSTPGLSSAVSALASNTSICERLMTPLKSRNFSVSSIEISFALRVVP
jgi:hypothetical protein